MYPIEVKIVPTTTLPIACEYFSCSTTMDKNKTIKVKPINNELSLFLNFRFLIARNKSTAEIANRGILFVKYTS